MTTAEICKAADIKGEALTLARDGVSPTKYVGLLEEKKFYKEAVKFIVYGVEPQVAIQWACNCVRELQAPDKKEASEKSLAASEAWLKAQEDKQRWAAKEAAEESGHSTPADIVAMAVFFSGGSITPPNSPAVPPPAGMAQKMAAGGIQIAVASDQPQKAEERFKKAISAGKTLAQAAPKTNFPPEK